MQLVEQSRSRMNKIWYVRVGSGEGFGAMTEELAGRSATTAAAAPVRSIGEADAVAEELVDERAGTAVRWC